MFYLLQEANKELKNLGQLTEDYNREVEELKPTLKTSKAKEADLCLKLEKCEERQKSLKINLNGEDAKTELQSELNTLRYYPTVDDFFIQFAKVLSLVF